MYINYYNIIHNINYDPYAAKDISYRDNGNRQQSFNNLSAAQDSTPVPEFETGYLAVEVMSVTGQPIKDALVTVFHFHDNGDLHVHYNLVTDENGRVPRMELPVRFIMPGRIDEQLYTNYNLRAFSKDYYPVNIINFRIYPNVEADYTFQLTPLSAIRSGTVPEETLIEPQNSSGQSHF